MYSIPFWCYILTIRPWFVNYHLFLQCCSLWIYSIPHWEHICKVDYQKWNCMHYFLTICTFLSIKFFSVYVSLSNTQEYGFQKSQTVNFFCVIKHSSSLCRLDFSLYMLSVNFGLTRSYMHIGLIGSSLTPDILFF